MGRLMMRTDKRQTFKFEPARADRTCVKFPTRHPDSGVTFVEILVAITLLGTAVVATMVTLRTSIKASSTDQDLAKAYEWVQSVSDQIYDTPRIPCYTTGGTSAAKAEYQTAANGAAKPPGWSAGSVTVTNVEFLGRLAVTDPFSWNSSSSFCFESSSAAGLYYTSPLYTQRVTFTVQGPPNTTSVTMEVVKSEK